MNITINVEIEGDGKLLEMGKRQGNYPKKN